MSYSKMRIVTKNYTDNLETVLTESPSTGDTVQNLKNYSRYYVFTTNSSGSSQTIEMKAPDVSQVSCVVFGRHNFSINTQIRIYLYSDNAWSNLEYDSGLLNVGAEQAGSDIVKWGEFLWGEVAWGDDTLADEFGRNPNYVHWIDTFAVAQTIRIVIYTPDRDVEISRLYIGKYIEPRFTLSYGYTLSYPESTKQYRKGGNTLRSTDGEPNKRFTFALNTINAEDRNLLQTGLRNVGLRKDFFISLFPFDDNTRKQEQYNGLMKLTKIPKMQEFNHNYYKSQYEMEEV